MLQIIRTAAAECSTKLIDPITLDHEFSAHSPPAVDHIISHNYADVLHRYRMHATLCDKFITYLMKWG